MIRVRSEEVDLAFVGGFSNSSDVLVNTRPTTRMKGAIDAVILSLRDLNRPSKFGNARLCVLGSARLIRLRPISKSTASIFEKGRLQGQT